MGEDIKVVAVLPVHNRRALTLDCLAALAASRHPGIDLRVIVVDDGSSDGTANAIAEQYPDVELVFGDGTLHYAAGTNAGLARALSRTCDYILAMNDDTRPPSDLVGRLVATALQNPDAVIGAALVLWDDEVSVFQVAPRWRLRFGGYQFPKHLTIDDLPAEPFEVELLTGNCVLYPRRAVEQVGFLPVTRTPHGSDAAYARRMRDAGWRLLVDPRARILCQPNTDPPPLSSVGGRAAVRSLLVDRRHPLNLQTLAIVLWGAAPSRPAAVAAYVVRVGRLAAKFVGLGGVWPHWPDPDAFAPVRPVPVRRSRRSSGTVDARP